MSDISDFLSILDLPKGMDYVSINALATITVGTPVRLVNNNQNPFYIVESDTQPTDDEKSVVIYGINSSQSSTDITNEPKEIWVKNIGINSARIIVYQIEE